MHNDIHYIVVYCINPLREIRFAVLCSLHLKYSVSSINLEETIWVIVENDDTDVTTVHCTVGPLCAAY